MGPWSIVGDIFAGWLKAKKLNEAMLRLHGWAKLIFGMALSFFLTFNTVAGTSLMADKGWAWSIGAGMVAGAAMALVAFLRADKKLTEGVVLAVPQATVEKQFDEQGRGPMVSSPPPEKK